jgi:hypothetical protein
MKENITITHLLTEHRNSISRENEKHDIAEIIKRNIQFSPQIQGYIIHGAIDEIQKYMEEKVSKFVDYIKNGIIRVDSNNKHTLKSRSKTIQILNRRRKK